MTYHFTNTRQTNDDLTHGFSDLIQQRIDDGWSGHLCSFMLKPINPNRRVAIELMKKGITRFYSEVSSRGWNSG